MTLPTALLSALALLFPVIQGGGGDETVGGLPAPNTAAGGSGGGTTNAGTPGVKDGSCWYGDGGSKKVEVGVEAQTSGVNRITITEAGGTGTESGTTDDSTEDPDGGMAESGTVTVDGNKFRIHLSYLWYWNGDAWIRMGKRPDCWEPPDAR